MSRPVDQAVAEAKKMVNAFAANKAPAFQVGDLIAVHPVVPTRFDEEGRPHPPKVVKQQVDDFCSEQKKAILTHSIGLALGVDIPTGMCFSTPALVQWSTALHHHVKRTNGYYEVRVTVDGGVYHIMDKTRYGALLRALHFALTRHDPDTDDHVQQRLWSELNPTTD